MIEAHKERIVLIRPVFLEMTDFGIQKALTASLSLVVEEGILL